MNRLAASAAPPETAGAEQVAEWALLPGVTGPEVREQGGRQRPQPTPPGRRAWRRHQKQTPAQCQPVHSRWRPQRR